MKTVLLAGGAGRRLAEETRQRPKPLVEIGDKPILWHILQGCSCYGLHEFVIALGYKGDAIKRYLADLCRLAGNIQLDFAAGDVKDLAPPASADPTATDEAVRRWRIDLVETGGATQTGGRIKRLAPYLDDEPFLLLWSDGLSDIDYDALIDFHRQHGRLATMAVVSPPSRFGHVTLLDDQVTHFVEKPQRNDRWINAGIFVLEPSVLDYIDGEQTQWEMAPLTRLAQDGELMAYRHHGFWDCMDTIHDRERLNELWHRGDAPWRVWA